MSERRVSCPGVSTQADPETVENGRAPCPACGRLTSVRPDTFLFRFHSPGREDQKRSPGPVRDPDGKRLSVVQACGVTDVPVPCLCGCGATLRPGAIGFATAACIDRWVANGYAPA